MIADSGIAFSTRFAGTPPYAAFSGHLDTPVHMIELRDRVRIRIDAQ